MKEELLKLNSVKRVSVMVARSDKQLFDELKEGRYDWQLFRRMIYCYQQYGHLVTVSDEAIAS